MLLRHKHHKLENISKELPRREMFGIQGKIHTKVEIRCMANDKYVLQFAVQMQLAHTASAM